jgi:hypothetical protein
LALWVLWRMTDASAFLHSIPIPPFLTDDFTGQLTLETPDEWNNIIKLVLPYVVMSFKVRTIVSSIRLSSHVPRSLHQIVTSLSLPVALANYYDCVIHSCTPLVTTTARLYVFWRETFPLDIPSVFPVDWPTAMA